MFCREIDDNKLLMKISLDIDKEMLLRPSGIQYKYAVDHDDDKSVVWEFVPKKMTDGQHRNRILSIPREKVQLTGMCLTSLYSYLY